MTEQKPKKKMNWGYGIALLYGGFVVFTLAIVGYASFQHFDLVERDYYARGLDYQQQIERMKRANALSEKPHVEFAAETQELVLSFSQSLRNRDLRGTVTVFRPSAASMDITAPLALDTALSQRISSQKLTPGLWRIKLNWSVDGVEYYIEQELMLR